MWDLISNSESPHHRREVHFLGKQQIHTIIIADLLHQQIAHLQHRMRPHHWGCRFALTQYLIPLITHLWVHSHCGHASFATVQHAQQS